LSVGKTEEQNTIDGSSNVDLTASEIILTPVMELNDDQDDQDEQDDRDPHYWSEVEMRGDYTEQSDISNDGTENEEIRRSDTTLLVIE
jgi:hypothetical protein